LRNDLPSTEDFLTPMHKGLRSMIYDLAARLQSTDLTDLTEAAPVLADLQHELGGPRPTACIVCLLHAHAGHEDIWAFPSLRAFDPMLLDELMQDHRELEERIRTLARMGNDLAAGSDPAARRSAARRLLLGANDLFAAYLGHMNREEAALVPLMNQRLTDGEILALRSAMERAMRPDRRIELFRWMLRSLDVHELTAWFRDVRLAAPPETLESLLRLADAEVDPARWAVARVRAGL
ncbi:hemerythrin/HHE cation-binding motif domain protein, partial [mine drainage metagenome]